MLKFDATTVIWFKCLQEDMVVLIWKCLTPPFCVLAIGTHNFSYSIANQLTNAGGALGLARAGPPKATSNVSPFIWEIQQIANNTSPWINTIANFDHCLYGSEVPKVIINIVLITMLINENKVMGAHFSSSPRLKESRLNTSSAAQHM